MKWSIPYSPGGLENQSVMLLRCFDLINRVKSEHESREQKKREKEMDAKKRTGARGGTRTAGRRR